MTSSRLAGALRSAGATSGSTTRPERGRTPELGANDHAEALFLCRGGRDAIRESDALALDEQRRREELERPFRALLSRGAVLGIDLAEYLKALRFGRPLPSRACPLTEDEIQTCLHLRDAAIRSVIS